MSTFWQAFFILLIFIPLTMLWIFAVVDLFRRKSLSAVAKILWLLAIIFFPLFGIFFYFLFRGQDAADTEDAARARRYDVKVTGTDVTDEFRKLAELRDEGILTDEEFQSQKTRLLESS